MKEYLIKYRPFLQFLAVFLLSYLVLIGIYQFYLGQFDAVHFEVDGFTDLVAQQTQFILETFGYQVELSPSTFDPSVKLAVNSVSAVRIVEGCNAISVMTLFTAFILAFSNGIAKTAGYIVGGIFIIHILNILRISLLTIGIIKYPEYTHILHDIVFPLFIYGVVFFLWIFWITKIMNYVQKTTTT